MRAGVAAVSPWASSANIGSIAMAASEPRPCHEARNEAHDEDEREEHERARPGLRVPVVIGALGILEDLQGECGDRLVRRQGPEPVAERGEEQWRRLAADAGDGDERSRRDARCGGAEN